MERPFHDHERDENGIKSEAGYRRTGESVERADSPGNLPVDERPSIRYKTGLQISHNLEAPSWTRSNALIPPVRVTLKERLIAVMNALRLQRLRPSELQRNVRVSIQGVRRDIEKCGTKEGRERMGGRIEKLLRDRPRYA